MTEPQLKAAIDTTAAQIGELVAADGKGETMPALKETLVANLQGIASGLADQCEATVDC